MIFRHLRAPIFFVAVLAVRAFAAGGTPGGDTGLSSDLPSAPPAVATPGGSALTASDAVIAVVEDRIITFEDLRREIFPRLQALQHSARNEQEYYKMLGELESDLLNELINRILIVKDFQKDPKRHIPSSYIDNTIAETLLTAPFDGDRAKFLSYLRDNGWTERDYRKKVEEDIIYSVMRNQQHKNESVVSPARIETYYQENPSKFYQETSAHWRMISFNRADGETDSQLLARVQPVLTRLQAGEKFDAVAREVSQDSMQTKGGDRGWQTKSALKPEFADPLFKLSPGQTTDPIVTPEGCYLLYLEERKAAGIQPLPDVSGEIEKILAAQMAREAEDHWIQRLRANAYVSVSSEFATADDPASPGQH
jgi:peptidyl-prolyl cis-trans isomerase SurA